MAEEQVAEQPPETGVSDSEPKEEPKEGGFVEFESPEVEARFKRVYGHMKQYERVSSNLAAENAKLVERLDKVESGQAEKDVNDRLTVLVTEEKEAMESGDFEKATEVRNKITDLKVDAKVPVKKEEPKTDSWLTPERERKIAEWSAATDDQGNLLRPWADPDHEDHQTAIAAAEVLIIKNQNMDLDDLLTEIEKVNGRITQKTTRPFASTLSGNSDVRPKSKKVSLTEDEKLAARKMYPGNPDAEKRYASAKEKYL